MKKGVQGLVVGVDGLQAGVSEPTLCETGGPTASVS
jgi:hypothetical protein